jgi:peptidyl-prolyl cis-trans isomerase C
VAKLTQEHAKTLSRRNLLSLEEFYQSKVLEDWVDISLLADEAEAQGLAVTPDELQQKVDALQTASEMPIDVEKALKSLGVTKTEFLNEMRDAILGEKLIRTRLAQAYSEDKLREIYNALPEKFITPPQVCVSHIFRALSGKETKKQKKVLYNEIKELRQRALAGQDFAALAKDSDAPSRDRGGDIGWFSAVNSLPKPLDTLIFELKVGKISKIVESRFGYHILKLTDARPATGLTFEDARPAVEDYVFATVRNDLLQAIKGTKRVTVIVEGQEKQLLLAPSQLSP